MPCRRATKLTVTPGSWVSATIASFSAGLLRRRRSGPGRTSLLKSRLVIDTTLLLPLSEVGEPVRSIKGPSHCTSQGHVHRHRWGGHVLQWGDACFERGCGAWTGQRPFEYPLKVVLPGKTTKENIEKW